MQLALWFPPFPAFTSLWRIPPRKCFESSHPCMPFFPSRIRSMWADCTDWHDVQESLSSSFPELCSTHRRVSGKSAMISTTLYYLQPRSFTTKTFVAVPVWNIFESINADTVECTMKQLETQLVVVVVAFIPQ